MGVPRRRRPICPTCQSVAAVWALSQTASQRTLNPPLAGPSFQVPGSGTNEFGGVAPSPQGAADTRTINPGRPAGSAPLPRWPHKYRSGNGAFGFGATFSRCRIRAMRPKSASPGLGHDDQAPRGCAGFVPGASAGAQFPGPLAIRDRGKWRLPAPSKKAGDRNDDALNSDRRGNAELHQRG